MDDVEPTPNIAASRAQTLLVPSMTASGFGMLSRASWPVFWKQSMHCGKVDLKGSEHAHEMTFMNDPGFEITELKLAMTGTTDTQSLIAW